MRRRRSQADANFLNQHPELKVVIGGYCDERGSTEYNLALGENRANAAKQALVTAGISPDRLRTVSYGKEKQFCTDHTEACWQQNRRATIHAGPVRPGYRLQGTGYRLQCRSRSYWPRSGT